MIIRHKKILEIMSDGRRVSVNALAEKLDVSQATVRQDLTRLENGGFLKRVHGGAVIDETDDISHRMGINYEIKLKIAKVAAGMIDEGETIFIECGSINALLAKEIANKHGVTIITNNAFVARQIGKKESGDVILLGGIYQTESESLVGNMVKLGLETMNFNKAFIGIDGFTPETGFTGRDMMRADVNNYIISKCPQSFVLTDSTKFGKVALSRYCAPDDVDFLITDSGISEEYKKFLASSGVETIAVD